MIIGTGILTFRIHGCRSLKEKRSVVKAIVSRIHNNFNISIAEVGDNDMHQQAKIGFALVGNNQKVINSKIDKILNLADNINAAEFVDSQMEVIIL
jgi:uncharacterized protein YlxP (DUF503 family)